MSTEATRALTTDARS